jgi:HEAT repeats/HEAT repeat
MACRPRDRRRRLRQGCLSAGVCFGLISPGAAQEHPASAAKSPPALAVEVEVTSDRLTLHAEGAPLAEVLRAIGEAGAFRVVLRGTFAAPVRESFADRPLEDAIRRLVDGHSVVILHENPDHASGAATLAEICVTENPARAVFEDANLDDPARGGAETAPDDATDPPMDREAFRLAHQGMPPPTREEILLEFGDSDPATRVAAVPKVGSLRPSEAIEVIAHVFASDEDTTVLSRAVAALSRLDGPGARGLLRERALADDDPGLRMQALNALASSRGERAVNVVAQALRQDPEPKVRLSAIRALGRVGGDWARRYLEAAARDRDPEISLAAEQALAAWPAEE